MRCRACLLQDNVHSTSALRQSSPVPTSIADSRPVLADYFITWDHYELVPKQLATDGPRCFVAAKESGLLVLELGNGTRRTTAAI